MKFAHKNQSPFFLGLKAEVEAYLQQQGKTRFGEGRIVAKGLFFFSLLLVSHLGIYLWANAWWQYAVCFVGAGLAAVLIVFNIVHDASHKAISRHKSINTLFRYLGDFVGINTYIWDIRHNLQHHTFTNVLGGDLIIENIPILRLSPHQPHHRFHRYQAFYAPLLYAFYSAYWILVIDFKLFFLKEICNLKNIRHSRQEWFTLFFFKAVYLTYAVVLPTLFTPLSGWQVMGLFMLGHAVAGLLLSIVAALGHFVEGPDFPKPIGEELPTSWAEHELATSIDFAPRSRFAHWITGGLNTHVAHHLFPRMCHTHYYRVTQVIAKYCQQHGYPYHQESFLSAVQSHFRYLNRLGKVTA